MFNSSTSPSGPIGVTPGASIPRDGQELYQFLNISIDASQIKSDFRKEALKHKKIVHDYIQACKDADRTELYIIHEFIPSRLRHNPMCTTVEGIRDYLQSEKARALARVHELAPLLKEGATTEQLKQEWFAKCSETTLKDTYISNLTLTHLLRLLPPNVIQVLEAEAQKSIAQIATRKEKILATITQFHRKTEKFILEAQSKDISAAVENIVEGNDAEMSTLVQAQQREIQDLKKQADNHTRELRELRQTIEDLIKKKNACAEETRETKKERPIPENS